MATLAAASKTAIEHTIDQATASGKIPGFVLNVVNKTGDSLVSYASGKEGADTDKPMTTDHVFWLASCSKLLGAISAMQQVEKGLIGLDDADKVEELVPELKDVKLIKEVDGKLTLVEKTKRITLRMLLTHTAGFSYTFFHPWLKELYPDVDELAGGDDVLKTALVFEPGTDWGYGASLDWAGVVIERLTKTPLSELTQKEIFEPLGIKDLTMYPSAEQQTRLAKLHQRAADGSIKQREHAYPTKATFESFGAGFWAKGSEYTKVLAALLDDGGKILSKESVDLMFTNQIPQWPNYGRRGIPAAKPEFTNPLPELFPQGESPQGWGISFMQTIEPTQTGRGANVGWWAGIMNSFWWVDREKGVAGLCQAQILPFGDMDTMVLWQTIEAITYQGLSA
ncbi:Acyltransferase LovD [Yarrowia sp. C11]|nr:Acyltransferase LovD [Yarrowia sp. E02]KAG5365153.1 Acyltransferase LovD [Yarrowia sp. C11]